MFILRGAPNTADCRRLLRRNRDGYDRRNRWEFNVVGAAVRFGDAVRIAPGETNLTGVIHLEAMLYFRHEA